MIARFFLPLLLLFFSFRQPVIIRRVPCEPRSTCPSNCFLQKGKEDDLPMIIENSWIVLLLCRRKQNSRWPGGFGPTSWQEITVDWIVIASSSSFPKSFFFIWPLEEEEENDGDTNDGPAGNWTRRRRRARRPSVPAHGLLFRASLVIFSTPCLLYGLCYYSNHVAALYSLYFLFLICFDSPIECCVCPAGQSIKKRPREEFGQSQLRPAFLVCYVHNIWVIFLLCELMDSLSSPLLRRFPWTPSVCCRLWQPTPLSIRDVFCCSLSAVDSAIVSLFEDYNKSGLSLIEFLKYAVYRWRYSRKVDTTR